MKHILVQDCRILIILSTTVTFTQSIMMAIYKIELYNKSYFPDKKYHPQYRRCKLWGSFIKADDMAIDLSHGFKNIQHKSMIFQNNYTVENF